MWEWNDDQPRSATRDEGVGVTPEKLCVSPDATVRQAMEAMNVGARGIVLVCDGDDRLIGTLTDGDIRRALLGGASLSDRCLPAVANQHYVSVGPDTSRAQVIDLMVSRNIRHVVITEGNLLLGLHLIDEVLGRAVRENWAVIMAGGKGSRLRPVTDEVPKPMVKVAGRPILERLVLHLVGWGFRRVFLAVNHLAQVIEGHFGDGSAFGCAIEYLREERPLESGGALSLLPEAPTKPVLVMNGDLVTDFNVDRMLGFHQRGEYVATMAVRPHTVDIPFGVAEVDGDELVRIREKPRETMLINAGIYVLEPELVGRVPCNVEFPITALIDDALARGLNVGVHEIDDEWADVGQRAELLAARGIRASGLDEARS